MAAVVSDFVVDDADRVVDLGAAAVCDNEYSLEIRFITEDVFVKLSSAVDEVIFKVVILLEVVDETVDHGAVSLTVVALAVVGLAVVVLHRVVVFWTSEAEV